MAEGNVVSAPSIYDDPTVEAFVSLLADCNPEALRNFKALLWQISEMEEQLKNATSTLADVRRELAEAKEPQLKRALSRVAAGLEQSIAAIREKVDTLKAAVVEGCKKAVDAFKERGQDALANVADFFKVAPMLEAVGRETGRAVARTDKALATIQEQTARYHKAGRYLRNAGRVLLGRRPITRTRGAGKLAQALENLCKREKAIFSYIHNRVMIAQAHLRNFEQTAHHPRPIRETMKELDEKFVQPQRERAARAEEHEGR